MIQKFFFSEKYPLVHIWKYFYLHKSKHPLVLNQLENLPFSCKTDLLGLERYLERFHKLIHSLKTVLKIFNRVSIKEFEV